MCVPYLTICDLVPILATMIGVEDTDGSVSVVLVHNFPFLSQSTLAGVDIVFPLGKHLLIREPSYTYTDTRKSAYIRVYSPTDLIFLEDDDPILRDVQWKSVFDRKPSLPSTVDGWRLEGHSQFNERQWLPAAICFTNALKLDSTSQIMLLNRAETYLKLGWYFSALHDVQQARRVGAIIDESLKRKAVMREIRAKYGMCLYEDVVHIAKEHPDDSECKEWLSKAIKRIAEKTRGKYDWGRIFREGRRNTKRFDVAEFQGPVEIRERDGQAGVLGVFVTRDIKIGELLVKCHPHIHSLISVLTVTIQVVGRPLDAALPTESKHGVERSSSGVIKFGDRRLGLHMTMVRLINRVWDDAHANAKMQCFYTGSFCNLDREPYPPVYGERRPLEHPLRPSVDIDGTRIECLAFTNMFCISADSDEKAHINAMYDFPSFLNHACVPSVESVTIGDIMVIRAMRNMTAGEEATIAYIGRDASFISRSSRLYKSWWFSCDCTLCEADRTDGLEACQKRDELMLRVDTISKVPLHLTPSIIAAQIANELKVIVLELRGTYKTTGIGRDALINRPELLEAMRILVEAVLASRNKPDFREYATANMFLLELTGIIIPDKSMDSRCGVIPIDTERSYCNEEELQMNVSSCLKIARYHDSVKNYTRARAWVDAAKWRKCLVSLFLSKDLKLILFFK